MSFCTAINCMDGRVQTSVSDFLKDRFGTDYVDVITEPGPDLILAEQSNTALVESIVARLNISVHKHQSKGIAIGKNGFDYAFGSITGPTAVLAEYHVNGVNRRGFFAV